MVDLTKLHSRQAVDLLAEGDPTMAAEILQGYGRIERDLREMLAIMLVGYSLKGAALFVKEKNGGIKKSTSDRDWKIYQAVENEIEASGCSADEAYRKLNGLEHRGIETIRKAYQRCKKAMDEYHALCREG